MFCKQIFGSRVLALGMAAALLLLFYPAEAWSQTDVGAGSLKGIIYSQDLTTPMENAVVKIRNIDDGEERESSPTDDTGAYEIGDIKEGRYVLGVTTAAGDFNFDYVVSIKANEKASLSMAVKPGASPVSGQAGGAAAAGGGFFSTTAGILLLITAAVLLTLGVITITAGPGPTSPAKKKK